MEIERYMHEYKKHSPRLFYDWLSRGKTMEVRFLNDAEGVEFKNWELIKLLGEHVKAQTRFNSIYINSFDQLKEILMFRMNGVVLTRLYNIFIGVNPRRKTHAKGKRGILYQSWFGGIAGTDCIQTILCDIEHTGPREGNATEAMIEDCVAGAKYLIDLYKLQDFYLNCSGNGVHLWIRLEEQIPLPVPTFTEFPDKIKYNYKEEPIYSLIKTYNRFIELLDKELKKFNPALKVDDGAKDISRIARPPGSWNVKKNKTQRAVGTLLTSCITEEFKNNLNKGINKTFMAAKPLQNVSARKFKEFKSQSSRYRCNHLNIADTPLVKLLLSQLLPSTLSRNHFLERSMARLLRDNEISLYQIDNLVQKINAVQQKSIQVDPDYLDDEEAFNPEMVNSYCVGCRIDLVYPVLDGIPDVKDDYLDDSRYRQLNSLSPSTIQKMAAVYANEMDYIRLKSWVRELVNKYSKAECFYILKCHLINKWEYYDRNRIVQQLLNKTRRETNEKT
jgi:hypothetical protein